MCSAKIQKADDSAIGCQGMTQKANWVICWGQLLGKEEKLAECVEPL